MAAKSTGTPPSEENNSEGDRRRLRRLGWLTAVLAGLLILVGVVQVKAAYDQDRANREIEKTQFDLAATQKCNIQFAIELGKALRPRDAVGDTTLAADLRLWRQFRDLIENQSGGGQQDALAAIDTYLRAVRALKGVALDNPYPTLKPCLDDLTNDSVKAIPRPLIRLVAEITDNSLAGPGLPGKWDNKCFHRRVTIRGTDADDTITGTDHRDVIFAYSGDDLVASGGGRDRICGRYGSDILNGGDGYDRVNGGKPGGLDVCFGEVARNCP